MAEETTEPTPEQVVDDALANALGVSGREETPTPAEPTAAPETPAEGAVTPAEGGGYDVAGKHYDSIDEVVKALENANHLISSREPAAEPEIVDEGPVKDPWSHVPGIPQQEKDNLYKWAIDKPLDAAKWAWQNPDALPEEIADQVILNGKTASPGAWDRFLHQEAVSAAQRIAGESTERFARNEIDTIATTAETELRAQLGAAYDEYEPLINARVEAGQFIKPPPGLSHKDAVMHVYYQVYRDVWLEKNFETVQAALAGAQPAAAPAAATPAAAAPAPAGTPLTASTGGAAPASESDDPIQAAINRALGFTAA